MIEAVDIAAGKIRWLCVCDVENDTDIAGLQLGGLDHDVIKTPPCDCGMEVCFYRRWASETDLPHRRAINALAQHLIKIGQSHPDSAAAHVSEKSAPPLLADLSQPLTDLTGRKAEAVRKAEEERQHEEGEFLRASSQRRIVAAAAVIKRLGLKREDEIPEDALAAELAKPADEILLASLPSPESTP